MDMITRGLRGGGSNKLDPSNWVYRTTSGITFTRDGDYIVANGTATATAYLNLTQFAYETNATFNRVQVIGSISTPSSGVALQVQRKNGTETLGTLNMSFSSALNTVGVTIDASTSAEISGYLMVTSGTVLKNVKIGIAIYFEQSSAVTTSFSPYSNICPISGHTKVNLVRCGKNLCDNSVFASYGGVLQEDGSYYFQNASTLNAKIVWENTKKVSGSIWLVYRFKYSSSSSSGVRTRMLYTDGSSAYNYTTPSTEYKKQVFVSNSAKTLDKIIFDYATGSVSTWLNVMVSLESATDYEPYQGETYTIELGDTIYGGTLDVTNGELTVDRAMVDLGSLTWVVPMDNRYYTNSLANVIKNGVDGGLWIQSSMFKAVPSLITVYESLNSMWLSRAGNVSCSKTASTVEDFKTAVTGQQLVYELAEPITIQLTPQQITTLLGNNTLYADTGDISVKYLAKKS